MSVKSVRAEIAKAMMPNRPMEPDAEITKDEAARIVIEAAKNGVTGGELNEVKRLSERGIDPMGVMTAAIPELSGDAFYLGKDAKMVLDGFIAHHGGFDGHPMTLAIPENAGDASVG